MQSGGTGAMSNEVIMLFPFFIRAQKFNFNKRFESLWHQEKRYGLKAPAEAQAFNTLYQTHQLFAKYSLLTQTRWGLIKSFAPGTNAFKTRIECAKYLDKSAHLFDVVEIMIKKTKEATLANKILRKTISDPQIYCKGEYEHLFARPRANDDLFIAPRRQYLNLKI